MQISKPIIFFDLETTGKNTSEDRIVEIAVIKLNIDSTLEKMTYRVKPKIPIPPQATAIHGITNEDVADKPGFVSYSKAMFEFFKGCDLAGYKILDYDVPLLSEEFARCEIEFPEADTAIMDIYRMEMHVNSHKLAATFERYTGQKLEGAHGALADTEAAFAVCFHILSKYFEDTITPQEIDNLLQGESKRVDIAGKLIYNEQGEIVWGFGEHKGNPILYDTGFFNWVMSKDFPADTKRILRQQLLK